MALKWEGGVPPTLLVCPISLGNGASGALVNTSSAFNTFVVVDNGNVFDGYGILGANIRTGTASDAVAIDYFYHAPKDDK